MTAEIAIMNKEAVALAADSAVTATLSSGQKIFTSADKIFALSDTSPVGIMFYNNAQFMGVPWDTIIKYFRSQLPKQGYDKLEDYLSYFIKFLEEDKTIITEKMRKEFLEAIAVGYSHTIREDIEKTVEEKINEQGSIDNITIEEIVINIINKHAAEWKVTKEAVKSSITKNRSRKIIKNNKEIIDTAIDMTFGNLPISKVRNRLFEIIEGLLHMGRNEQLSSGVVIAGFGEKEAFPTTISVEFEGLFDNKLKHWRKSKSAIGVDTSATIAAYAQREMVHRFMEGIGPFFLEIMTGYLSQLPENFAKSLVRRLRKYSKSEKQRLESGLIRKCKKIIDDFNQNMIKEKDERFIQPITNIVSVLPKNELAALAESLISLTIVKRKFSPESETVAEPIDIALISKGDGFIWMKRKHYFQKELNPAFFSRRFKE